MIDFADIEEVIANCFEQLQEASRDRYDSDKADKTAALFLVAQMKVSFLIEDFEANSRHAKNEVSRIEGEKYFEYKMSGSEKKTENTITAFVSKETEVVEAKKECAKQEATLKKWNYVLSSLKDGHIYFRNIGKNKTWSE